MDAVPAEASRPSRPRKEGRRRPYILVAASLFAAVLNFPVTFATPVALEGRQRRKPDSGTAVPQRGGAVPKNLRPESGPPQRNKIPLPRPRVSAEAKEREKMQNQQDAKELREQYLKITPLLVSEKTVPKELAVQIVDRLVQTGRAVALTTRQIADIVGVLVQTLFSAGIRLRLQDESVNRENLQYLGKRIVLFPSRAGRKEDSKLGRDLMQAEYVIMDIDDFPRDFNLVPEPHEITRVSNTTNVGGLAAVIASKLRENKKVTLSVLGLSAQMQALKAVGLSQKYLEGEADFKDVHLGVLARRAVGEDVYLDREGKENQMVQTHLLVIKDRRPSDVSYGLPSEGSREQLPAWAT